MTPLTRKENYLNEIVGWGETAPEKPLTPEEFFFAAILGEAVQTPEPLSRYQIYLAKIAGRNISVPKPLTRLELFLAKACGMDIETPTPITREEIFWSNYTAIVDFEVEGVPPLTYKAIEGTLENYRIYGNTENGESVGDRTENLFDGECYNNNLNWDTGNISSFSIYRIVSDLIFLTPGTYTFSNSASDYVGLAVYDDTKTFIGIVSYQNKTNPLTQTVNNNQYFRVLCKNNTDTVALNPNDMRIMVVEGSTALPYEPYGYRVPVTVTNGNNSQTTNLYLPEQIKMVGDEAEYVDYKEQKQHFADGTSVDVTLPALPTIKGTNVLSVGTAVQPSEVYVKGKIKEIN